MSFSLVFTRTSNPPPLPPLLVRLFSVYAVVPIIVPFLGCVRLSGHIPRLLLFSFIFYVDSNFCWCEKNTGRHFIGFYLEKYRHVNQQHRGDKFTTQTDKNRINASGRQKYCFYLILGSNTWSLHYYSQMDKILDMTQNDYGLSL